MRSIALLRGDLCISAHQFYRSPKASYYAEFIGMYAVNFANAVRRQACRLSHNHWSHGAVCGVVAGAGIQNMWLHQEDHWRVY